MNLTEREIELIDGMIEVQLHHAAQCQNIINHPNNGNVVMATKQLGSDLERVELLHKMKKYFETKEPTESQKMRNAGYSRRSKGWANEDDYDDRSMSPAGIHGD